MLMAISMDPRLSKPKHVSLLPTSWGTLYALSRLDAKEWKRATRENLIRPDVQRKEITAFRKEMRKPPKPESQDGCTAEDLQTLIDAGHQFGTIYADPPWAYGNQSTRAATDNHYETMSVDDLCDLPIVELAAEKSLLHLWTTNGFLFESHRLMEAWGFTYKSCFVWVKPQMGIGNYWRVSHEFMLLGSRGGQTFEDASLMSWGEFPRTRHSAKPAAVRDMVERAGPGPYLELFGREEVPGWMVWGNQVSRNLFVSGVQA